MRFLGGIAVGLRSPARRMPRPRRSPREGPPAPDTDTDCAGLDVPVDPARPDGRCFTLRLGRLPALDPAQRKGVLPYIPGGPGAGIAKIIGGDSRTVQHVDEFRRQWDVVSFDPRGIQQSSPIRSSPDLVPPATAPTDHPPTAAHNSQTRLVNALSIWVQIPYALLLIADVDGPQGLIYSRCAFAAVARFLDDPGSVATTTLRQN